MQDVINIAQEIKPDAERVASMVRVQDHFVGGPRALSDTYFKAPSKETEELFNKQRKSLTHINLVRPVVRTWQSILSGSDINRQVDTPQDIVNDYVQSYEYSDMIYNWVENTLLYGTSVAVPMYDQQQDEIRVWLPNPLRTVIITNPVNLYDTLAVIEINDEYIQGICKWGDFAIYKSGESTVNQYAYSYLPVSIAYGIDRRHAGSVYGLGMCDAAVDMTIRITSVAFNITMLQTSQTRSIFRLIGDLNKLLHYDASSPIQPGFSPDGRLMLPPGFTADFISPDPKLQGSIEVQKMFSELLSCTTGIPQDIISTTGVTSPSAEAAKIRALPLEQQAKIMIPKWANYEKQLILAMAYLVDFFESGQSWIPLKDIKKRSRIEIRNKSRILPISTNEVAQTDIALYSMGAKRLKDIIEEHNHHLSEEEILQMVADQEEKLKQASVTSITDAALKAGKDALTPEQKSQADN